VKKDISKQTVAIILFCAILLSVFSTMMVLNKQPIVRVQRYQTVAQQGQVGVNIIPAPEQTATVGLTIIEPPEGEKE